MSPGGGVLFHDDPVVYVQVESRGPVVSLLPIVAVEVDLVVRIADDQPVPVRRQVGQPLVGPGLVLLQETVDLPFDVPYRVDSHVEQIPMACQGHEVVRTPMRSRRGIAEMPPYGPQSARGRVVSDADVRIWGSTPWVPA